MFISIPSRSRAALPFPNYTVLIHIQAEETEIPNSCSRCTPLLLHSLSSVEPSVLSQWLCRHDRSI